MNELVHMKDKERRTRVFEMTADDARVAIAELQRDLFDLRLKQTRGEVKDIRQFAKARKAIAMLKHKIGMAQLLAEVETVSEEAEEA